MPDTKTKTHTAKFGEVVRYVAQDGSEHPAVVHADVEDGFGADLVVLGGGTQVTQLKFAVPHADTVDPTEVEGTWR